uniref:Uncharacterized protein n=1 Tax=Macaca fascicularis TaxID=9541 RepID=I7GMA4_MACFA|nr:unnamed protein product [Macaca fascicularis]
MLKSTTKNHFYNTYLQTYEHKEGNNRHCSQHEDGEWEEGEVQKR